MGGKFQFSKAFHSNESSFVFQNSINVVEGMIKRGFHSVIILIDFQRNYGKFQHERIRKSERNLRVYKYLSNTFVSSLSTPKKTNISLYIWIKKTLSSYEMNTLLSLNLRNVQSFPSSDRAHKHRVLKRWPNKSHLRCDDEDVDVRWFESVRIEIKRHSQQWLMICKFNHVNLSIKNENVWKIIRLFTWN